MKIGKATEKYEAWLGRHLCILEADLQLKHEQMRSETCTWRTSGRGETSKGG